MRKPLSSAYFVLAATFLLGGCSTLPRGWDDYKSAMKCHLQGKDVECDKAYEKAIKKNNKLQGVHASYGTHLLKRGEVGPAQEEFKLEIANHPVSETAVTIAFKNVKHPDSSGSMVPKTNGGK